MLKLLESKKASVSIEKRSVPRALLRAVPLSGLIALAAALAMLGGIWDSAVWIVIGSVFVFLLRFFAELRRDDRVEAHIKALENFKRRQLDATLTFLGDWLFNEDTAYRFTVLRPTSNGKSVTMHRRYRCTDGITDSNSSDAAFPRSVGLAGKALENGNELHQRTNIPEFTNRDEFDRYYVATLGLPAKLVGDLSDYMMTVRAIACIGIVGRESGKCVAVLAIDSQKVGRFDEDTEDAITFLARHLGSMLDP